MFNWIAKLGQNIQFVAFCAHFFFAWWVVHHDSPHDALINALEKVEDMESVLIIYEGKEGHGSGSFDSDLKVSEALYLTELFRHWLMSYVLGERG